MNGTDFLLDTNILIYLLQGDERFKKLVEGKGLFLSFISELELLSKPDLNKTEIQRIKALLKGCYIIDINPDIKSNTIRIRSMSGLKLPDSIIVATAQYLQMPVLTADKAFSKVELSDIELFLIEA